MTSDLIRVPTSWFNPGIEDKERAREASTRDMMWVPLRGKDTEVWAARSPDGQRLYNVRREWTTPVLELNPRINLGAPVSLWTALWSRIDDGIPNVFTSRFLSLYEAKLACETLEHSFPIDMKEVEEFQKYSQSKLSQSPGLTRGWTFQGIYNGISCWTFRQNKHDRKCYVIINNMKDHKQQYELTLRTFTGDRYTNMTKLKIEFIDMFNTLEKAQAEVARLLK